MAATASLWALGLQLALALALAHSPAAAAADAPNWDVSLGIMDGADAADHEFPSQVFLLSHIEEPWSGRRALLACGGSVISNRWVLTAAHCVNGSVRTEVRAGSRDRGAARGAVKALATRIVVHEKYRLYGRNDNNAADDIALVEVALPLDGRRVAAVPLAQGSPPQVQGVVLGWGRTRQNDLPQILQKLKVKLIPCPEKTPKAICIRSPPGTGICSGDSGGPLLVGGELHGVASYIDLLDKQLEPNEHCGDARAWGVYMRVASYRPWILQHTRPRPRPRPRPRAP